MKILPTLLVSGSVALSAIYIYKYFYNNNIDIEFVNKTKGSGFIYKDNDNYIKNMSSHDLYARKVKTTDEYLLKSAKDVINFSNKEKNILTKCIIDVEKILTKKRSYLFDHNLLKNIPWKIILTSGYYEEGLPHTRDNYIIISKDLFNTSHNDMISTLIHEKIHLYQRKYKPLFQKALHTLNYKIHGLRTNYPRIRSNPDVDEYVYIHPSNFLMISRYNSDTPYGIADVDNSHDIEHPNEEYAYRMTEDIF
jgi:hypothetical protein